MVNIVFVTTSFGGMATGPEIYTHYLWEAFRDDKKIDFHVVAPRNAGPNPHEHNNLHLVNTSIVPGAMYRQLADAAVKVARGLVGRTIIHCNNSHLSSKLLKANVPVWGQVNDITNAELPSNWLSILKHQGLRRLLALFRRMTIEKQMVNNQELTICNSNATKSVIIDAYRPEARDRVITVYKSVDLDYFSNNAGPREDAKTFRAVFIGSDFIRKGLDTLIEALGRMTSPIETLILGVTEAQYLSKFPSHKSTIERLKGKVVFAGVAAREDVRNALCRANLMVLPTRSEALGVAILEALATRCFVLSTNVGGVPEILNGLKSGVLLNNPSSEHLANELTRISRERPDLDPQNWLGTKEHLAEFSKERMINTLADLYNPEPKRR